MKKLFCGLLIAFSLTSASYAEDWLSLILSGLFSSNSQQSFNVDEIQQEDRRVNFVTNHSKIYSNAWKEYQKNPNRCPTNRWGQRVCF